MNLFVINKFLSLSNEYKIFVLEALLKFENGKIEDTEALWNEFKIKELVMFPIRFAFCEAVFLIENYADDGGTSVTGGTGLDQDLIETTTC